MERNIWISCEECRQLGRSKKKIIINKFQAKWQYLCNDKCSRDGGITISVTEKLLLDLESNRFGYNNQS
jgi:hypothetical protein